MLNTLAAWSRHHQEFTQRTCACLEEGKGLLIFQVLLSVDVVRNRQCKIMCVQDEPKGMLENKETNGQDATKEGDGKVSVENRDAVMPMDIMPVETKTLNAEVPIAKKKPVSYAKRRHEALKSFTGGLGMTGLNGPKPDEKQLASQDEVELGKKHPIIQFEAGRCVFILQADDLLRLSLAAWARNCWQRVCWRCKKICYLGAGHMCV